MNILSKPYYWVSAHRDITYTFEYPNVYALTAVVGSDGKAVFVFMGDGIHSLSPGEYLFCESGLYKGYHKVTGTVGGFSDWYATETDYTASQTGGTIRFIENHVFELYSGYQSGDMADIHEYTKIAEFKPEPNASGQLVVNISGYVNKIFDVINSNDTATVGALTIFPNLFNQVTLLIDSAVIDTHIVLNAAITAFELNRDYVDTGRSLNGGSLGNHYLSCGDTLNMLISGDFLIAGPGYSEGTKDPIPPDFTPADFDTNDFQTAIH